ncbi:uncharacterized protein [Miscanthus floridulus]|uniref:uncharacterized protein n=1 Tax=Miscanthus floridulus TaxID=154761 RepID=UPI00345968AA
MEQAEEKEPMPREAEAHESDEAEAPSVTEATEGEAEAPRTSEAEAMESVEVEDLRLCCADMTAKAATAWEQAAPLVARIKELEEELTRVADEWDTFRSRAEEATASAKALAGQLGAKQGTHLLMKGTLAEALKVAKASQVEALELEKEVSRATEASVEVQAVLEAEI